MADDTRQQLALLQPEYWACCALGHVTIPQAKPGRLYCYRGGQSGRSCPAKTVLIRKYPAVLAALKLGDLREADIREMLYDLGAFACR